jgi:hypothetical protein
MDSDPTHLLVCFQFSADALNFLDSEFAYEYRTILNKILNIAFVCGYEYDTLHRKLENRTNGFIIQTSKMLYQNPA